MNIGDKIIIKPRESSSNWNDYPLGYLTEMSNDYKDCIATIVDKSPMSDELIVKYSHRKFWNEDSNFYLLDIDHKNFFWHSSMFYSNIIEKSNLDNIF